MRYFPWCQGSSQSQPCISVLACCCVDDENKMPGFNASETEGDEAMAKMIEAVDADLNQFLAAKEPGATEVGHQ